MVMLEKSAELLSTSLVAQHTSKYSSNSFKMESLSMFMSFSFLHFLTTSKSSTLYHLKKALTDQGKISLQMLANSLSDIKSVNSKKISFSLNFLYRILEMIFSLMNTLFPSVMIL